MNNRSSELPSTTEKLPLSSSLPLIQDSKTLTLFLLRKKSQKALTLLLHSSDEKRQSIATRSQIGRLEEASAPKPPCRGEQQLFTAFSNTSQNRKEKKDLRIT